MKFILTKEIMKFRLLAFSVAAAIIFVSPTLIHASGAKLRVVASIAPLADFARQVGGDKVRVMLLLPPGASPHTFEPTPKMMLEIINTDIFIKIGAGLEFWADRFVTAAGRKIDIVEASKGIELIGDHGSEKRGKHTGHGTADPHIWLDPISAVKIVEKISEAFSKTDPPNAAYYRLNSSAYINKLKDLDREIAQKTGNFRAREYVTFHPAWNYFSRRYDLKVAAVIEEGPGKEPTPKHLAKILSELRRIKARIVFAEPQFSSRIAEVIAREAGAKVLFLDPLGGQEGRETYIETMRHNVSVMEKAMR